MWVPMLKCLNLKLIHAFLLFLFREHVVGRENYFSFPCWGALYHKDFPLCSNNIFIVTTSALPAGVNTVALTYRFPGVKKQSISCLLAGFGFTLGLSPRVAHHYSHKLGKMFALLANYCSDCVASHRVSASLENQAGSWMVFRMTCN